jgi:hypothetical protein
VTFFHNKEINNIVCDQISQQMVQELFFKRRETYGKGVNEMNTRSEKTKESIHERIHADTNTKISAMSEIAYDEKIESKLQTYVLSVSSRQQHQNL